MLERQEPYFFCYLTALRMSSSRPLDNPSPVVLQNPNPSVHQSSSVGPSRRNGKTRDEKSLLRDLWAGGEGSSGEDETDEVEEQLDADEVFGECGAHVRPFTNL